MLKINFLENLNLDKAHNVLIFISSVILIFSLFFEVKILDQKMIQILSFMYVLVGFFQEHVNTFVLQLYINKANLMGLILKEDSLNISIISLIVNLFLLILPFIIYFKVIIFL